MGHKPDILPRHDFLHTVRSALAHLYDPDYLRQSQLAERLGVAGRFDTPTVLQRILTEAVEAQKPDSRRAGTEPAQARYELLMYRYLQQFGQDEVAHQLGLSVRQLRRHQNAAIYAVASYLWERYAPAETASPATPLPDELTELAWLRNASGEEQTEVADALEVVLSLSAPLARQKAVTIAVEGERDWRLDVHPIAFRQSLLHLLSLAMRSADGTQVNLAIRSTGQHVELEVRNHLSAATWQPTPDDYRQLQVIEQVVTLSHGRLVLAEAGQPFWATLAFHRVDQIRVLVVEDNEEIVDVIRRYTACTPYQIHGITDPLRALTMAEAIEPDVVIVDIMMPQLDGLQLLATLKLHPALGACPVIVCSVLPQADLATALGASGYLAKPFKRTELLELLEQVSGAMRSDSPAP